jgi:hypothetical protein
MLVDVPQQDVGKKYWDDVAPEARGVVDGYDTREKVVELMSLGHGTRIAEGIYDGTINFHNSCDDGVLGNTFFYGVADNLEQILEHFKDLVESETPYCISTGLMTKASQPERDGWRWHKWGEYIGTKNPQCEYLYDEPEIEEALTFSIHRVLYEGEEYDYFDDAMREYEIREHGQENWDRICDHHQEMKKAKAIIPSN